MRDRRLRACRLAFCLAITWIALLAGCAEQPPGHTRADFEKRWHDAINNREAEDLYFLLDSKSRRHVDHMLETLRGFGKNQQQVVLNHLGGERVNNLHEMRPEAFFSLWWNKVTQTKQPTMTLKDVGSNQATMVLTLGDKTQPVALVRESGRWAWRLPQANFEFRLTSKSMIPKAKPKKPEPKIESDIPADDPKVDPDNEQDSGKVRNPTQQDSKAGDKQGAANGSAVGDDAQGNDSQDNAPQDKVDDGIDDKVDNKVDETDQPKVQSKDQGAGESNKTETDAANAGKASEPTAPDPAKESSGTKGE